MAKVALSFDAWKPGAVQPATVEVVVEVLRAAESAQLLATLKGQEDYIWQAAWAPDGKTLATLAHVTGEVKLWNVAERKVRATLRSDLGAAYSMAFSPGGQTLYVGHYRNEGNAGPTGGIVLWDVAAGIRKGVLQQTPPRGVARLAISADGKTIAATESVKEGGKAAFKRYLTYWDVGSGKAHSELADGSTNTMAFSPSGKVLAWSAYVLKDNKLAAVEVRRRDLTKEQDLPALANTVGKNPINCLAFSPDGATLAGADFEGNILLWDTASGKVRTTIKQEDLRRIMSLAFTPDGKTLAAAIGDRPGVDREPGLISLWDPVTGRRRLTLTGHTHGVTTVAFSPDAKVLASGSSDRTLRLWDMTSLMEKRQASGER